MALSPIAIAGRRLGAFVIDNLFLALMSFLFAQLLALMVPVSQLFHHGVFFLIAGLYFTLLNSNLLPQQTLGKQLFSITACDLNGQPLSVSQSALRFLMLYVPLVITVSDSPLTLPEYSFVFIIALVTVNSYLLFLTPTKQCIHDLLLHTQVDSTTAPTPAQALDSKHYLALGGLVLLSIGLWAQLIHHATGTQPEFITAQHQIQNLPHINDVQIRLAPITTAINGKERTTNNILVNVTLTEDPKQIHEDLPALQANIMRIINETDPQLDADNFDITITHDNYYWLLTSSYRQRTVFARE